MVKLIWTTPALNDLHSIMAFVAKDSPRYAERLATRIVRAPQRLVQFPHSGRIVPELNDPDIRELIYSSYRIVYVFRAAEIHIVAILHSSRDVLQNLLPGNWDVD